MNVSRFIRVPHLPENPVSLLLIGEKYRKSLEKPLADRGTQVLWLPDNTCVDSRLSGHADLSVMHVGANVLVFQRCYESSIIVNYLTNRGFLIFFTEIQQNMSYPSDAGLCACIVGKHILHKAEITDPTVKRLIDDKKFININQGYAKCSVCTVDSESIITSDAGAAKAAKIAGLNVLETASGEIALDGFDTGFIGGALFKISHDTMLCTGTLDTHPDKERITEFLSSRGIKLEYLTNERAFDIGSAVLLEEAL